MHSYVSSIQTLQARVQGGDLLPPPIKIEIKKRSSEQILSYFTYILQFFSGKYHFLGYFLSWAPLGKLKSKKKIKEIKFRMLSKYTLKRINQKMFSKKISESYNQPHSKSVAIINIFIQNMLIFREFFQKQSNQLYTNTHQSAPYLKKSLW